jgi:hypothetical protein
MRFLFILLAGLLSIGCTAQSFTVSGFVIDGNKTPVFTGNVVAFQMRDSSYINGDVITEGRFELKIRANDSILIKCASIGYDPVWLHVFTTDSVLQLDTIQLMNSVLNTVEIRAVAPVVQNKGNKLVVDVENTSLSAMGTAYEVLENTPGLLVNTDGSVTVFGRGTALLYLDGQRIPAQMLRSVPSTQISSVEILKNPPASYDAQGRAVVNIVTKKKAMEGYNVDLFQAATYTPNIYGYTGINGYWRKNKWTITGRSGFFLGTRWENTLYLRSFTEDTVNYTMRNNVHSDRHYKGTFYPGATFQYRPDSISHFDLSLMTSLNSLVVDIDNSNLITTNSAQSEILAKRKDEESSIDYQATLGYTRSLDSLGSEIYTSVSYTDYNSLKLGTIAQNVTTPASVSSSDLRNSSENGIRFAVGQFNYTKCFDTIWKVETGIKYTQITNRSDVGLQRYTSGEWVDDSTIANSFKYGEQTLAGFAQTYFQKRKWYATAGIRAELTKTDGRSLLYDSTLIDTAYINLFPVVELNYTIMKDLVMSLDYSWNIERPSFQDLDPFLLYIDSLSYIKGNPALRPEYTHDFSAELIYLEAASISFSYAYTKQAMDLFVTRTGPNNSQFIGQTRNFDYAKTIGFEIALPYQTSWWTTYNSAGYNKSIFHFDNGTEYAHNDAEGWFFVFYNKFSLKKHWSLEGIYWYSTGGGEGLFMARPMSSLRVSIQYKSTDGNFSVRLIGNDLLYHSYARADSRIPGFDLYYEEPGDSRFVRVAFSYRFGKVKQQELNQRSNNDSERSRIKS